jgi:hypothetical protein
MTSERWVPPAVFVVSCVHIRAYRSAQIGSNGACVVNKVVVDDDDDGDDDLDAVLDVLVGLRFFVVLMSETWADLKECKRS